MLLLCKYELSIFSALAISQIVGRIIGRITGENYYNQKQSGSESSYVIRSSKLAGAEDDFSFSLIVLTTP